MVLLAIHPELNLDYKIEERALEDFVGFCSISGKYALEVPEHHSTLAKVDFANTIFSFACCCLFV